MAGIFRKPEKQSMYWRELMRQMIAIGVESIPIVALVSIFIGAVTAIQFAYQISDFMVPMYYIGFIVRDTMIIEMAPTLTCIMLAGKAGSNMSSELGNMRISGQIDALEVMGLNTIPYLVSTKIIATILMTPFLITIAAFLGIMGGYIANELSDISTSAEYTRGLREFFVGFNVQLMLIKGFVFSFLLSSISCFYGFNVKGGAIEIGDASTRSVVQSDIAILIFDFIIAKVLLT